jgi:hypothetical protein
VANIIIYKRKGNKPGSYSIAVNVFSDKNKLTALYNFSYEMYVVGSKFPGLTYKRRAKWIML